MPSPIEAVRPQGRPLTAVAAPALPPNRACYDFSRTMTPPPNPAQPTAAASRISRDKVNKLAHTVTEALATLDEVEFIEDRNSIRLEIRRLLEELLAQEARIDAAARQKIENQRRTILEGSQEWDILYRKYYNEEVKKLGI
jgi:uncharacterized protein